MKFSAMQMNGYGVVSSQSVYPIYEADDRRMSATGDIIRMDSEALDEGSMVSNLPLLFANGYPTSLEKITLAELERFVNFMVQCSLGHDTADVIRQPQWWPKEVKFSNPLARPKKLDDNWTANLKRLVFRCYTFHRSEYILRFCCFLAKYPHDELEYVNNWDSTTSLYHKPLGRLMVTFRNENMNYDKKSEYPFHPRRSLLGGKQALPMVQPPCEDIYLCDNCDAEFIGLEKMKEHEKTCPEGGNQSNSRPGTPDSLIMIEPELEQDKFLQFFQLMSKNKEQQQSCLPVPTTSPTTSSAAGLLKRRASTRVRGSLNLTRCPTIPFSSPAGLALSKKSKAMTEETQQERLERIERHSNAPVLHNDVRPKWFVNRSLRNYNHDQWSVTYKLNKHKKYVHQYKFRRSSKIKPMLSIRSQIMYMICRPLRVSLKRLTKNQLEALRQNPSLYKAPGGKRKLVAGDEQEPITIEDEEGTNNKNSIASILLVDLCSSSSSDDEDENRDPKTFLNNKRRTLTIKKKSNDNPVFNNNNNINCTSISPVLGFRSNP